jgi:hypothetical protein
VAFDTHPMLARLVWAVERPGPTIRDARNSDLRSVTLNRFPARQVEGGGLRDGIYGNRSYGKSQGVANDADK